MSTEIARESARRADGKFGEQVRAEADISLDEDPFPRTSDGSIDVAAAVRSGIIEGFSTTKWDEPKTVSFHGHWEGNLIVVESIYDGDVADNRPETGYWSEGLWASSATGSSDAEIAAMMLDEYEESDSIRVATDDDDMTPTDDDEDEG